VLRTRRRRCLLCLATVVAASACLVPTATAAYVDPQVAGLQVALRAYKLYTGPIDGISGPATRSGIKLFQKRVGLQVDGVAGPATRRAFGPLGRPLFGKRTMQRGLFGFDVSVLQFLLARGGELVPISGYFDARTARALRHYQRAHELSADGVAGRLTLTALTPPPARAAQAVLVRSTSATPSRVTALLDYWADHYGVDRRLVRAVAWQESGYQTNLTSSAGAWGVMQILPGTWKYVEKVLIGHPVPHTTSGNIHVGVAYLRQLLREFGGSERRALAAWNQGPASVRRHGALRETKAFVANVLALRRSPI
jgi:hypothetical protein